MPDGFLFGSGYSSGVVLLQQQLVGFHKKAVSRPMWTPPSLFNFIFFSFLARPTSVLEVVAVWGEAGLSVCLFSLFFPTHLSCRTVSRTKQSCCCSYALTLARTHALSHWPSCRKKGAETKKQEIDFLARYSILSSPVLSQKARHNWGIHAAFCSPVKQFSLADIQIDLFWHMLSVQCSSLKLVTAWQRNGYTLIIWKMAIPDVLAAVVDSKLTLMGAPIIALHNFCSLIDCNVEPLPYFYILEYQQCDNFI